MHLKLYIGNSTYLRAEGVKFEDADDGDFLLDATVEATVKDLEGNEVSGQTWPIMLDFITDSDGNYQGILSSELELEERSVYSVFLTISKDANVGYWKGTVKAEYRSFEGDC